MKHPTSQILASVLLTVFVALVGCSTTKNPTHEPPTAQNGVPIQPTAPTSVIRTQTLGDIGAAAAAQTPAPTYYAQSYAVAGAPAAVAQDDDVNFYDSTGTAVAYIDTSQDLTIYLWSGKPCAYLDGENIYGFNGKHLGWFHSGIVYDHDGYAVAGVASAFLSPVQLVPLKGLKQLCPLKSLKELSPLKPLFIREWSATPAQIFFLSGASE